jgi:hypothetical protein
MGEGGLRNLKLQLKPTKEQRKLLDDWINTSRYIYNKTVDRMNTPRFRQESKNTVRDRYVTLETRKSSSDYASINASIKELTKKRKRAEKDGDGGEYDSVGEELKAMRQHLNAAISPTTNAKIKPWELRTPTKVRVAAVFDAFNARDVAFTNLKQGNIRGFRLGHRMKKAYAQTISIPATAVKVNKDGDLVICPDATKK